MLLLGYPEIIDLVLLLHSCFLCDFILLHVVHHVLLYCVILYYIVFLYILYCFVYGTHSVMLHTLQ